MTEGPRRALGPAAPVGGGRSGHRKWNGEDRHQEASGPASTARSGRRGRRAGAGALHELGYRSRRSWRLRRNGGRAAPAIRGAFEGVWVESTPVPRRTRPGKGFPRRRRSRAGLAWGGRAGGPAPRESQPPEGPSGPPTVAIMGLEEGLSDALGQAWARFAVEAAPSGIPSGERAARTPTTPGGIRRRDQHPDDAPGRRDGRQGRGLPGGLHRHRRRQRHGERLRQLRRLRRRGDAAYLVIGSKQVNINTAVDFLNLTKGTTNGTSSTLIGGQRAGDLGELGTLGVAAQSGTTAPTAQTNPTVFQPSPAMDSTHVYGFNYDGLRFVTGLNATTNTGRASSLGFSVTALGDINGDGIDDFAISAPNDAGGGKVFVIWAAPPWPTRPPPTRRSTSSRRPGPPTPRPRRRSSPSAWQPG